LFGITKPTSLRGFGGINVAEEGTFFEDCECGQRKVEKAQRDHKKKPTVMDTAKEKVGRKTVIKNTWHCTCKDRTTRGVNYNAWAAKNKIKNEF